MFKHGSNQLDFRGATIQESDFSGVVFNGFAAENVDFQYESNFF